MGLDVRHACYRCGGSCQGPGALVEPTEADAITGMAAALGVVDPVVDGRLRTVGARCVFLQEDNLCALHLAHGPSAKPRGCQAWPRVDRDGGQGIDPGCLTAFLSAGTGPIVGSTPVWPPDPVVDRLTGTLAQAWGRLLGEAAGIGRPPPSETAWLDTHLDAVLDALLDPGSAPGLRARLRHLTALRGRTGPCWALEPEVDAHAVEVARAMVRLGRIPDRDPVRVARDLLRGAALCAWAEPSLPRFAPALAAWSRLQRYGPLRDVLDA